MSVIAWLQGMDPAKASRTAIVAAFFRAHHHASDGPKIFDDPLAQSLLPHIERIGDGILARAGMRPSRAERMTTLSSLLGTLAAPASVLARARYAEDRVLEAIGAGIRQYVLVGAGLETFALRRPELENRVRVFEVDHPSTQAFKREALGRAGLRAPANLHFVAADFETATVADALRRSPFDPALPTVFSWQGVVVYLTLAAIRETLRSIRSVAAPGSLLLLSYIDADAFRPERASPRVQQMIDAAREIGEPFLTGFDLPALRAELAAAGFDLIEDVGPEEQQRRYFDERRDGYRAAEHSHFACAAPASGVSA